MTSENKRNILSLIDPSTTNTTKDGVVAGSLITAPAWAPLLSTFNDLLTMVTLIIGLIIGLIRLWALVKKGNSPDEKLKKFEE
ncbi:MAG: hypothetical protein AAF228_05055 [Pseudomonadota bacterium]